MPEAHHRCVTCSATFADHEDPEIGTCSAFIPRTTQLVEGLQPDALEQAARTVAQVDGRPERAILLSDLRNVLDQLSGNRLGGSVVSILAYLQEQAAACQAYSSELSELVKAAELRRAAADEALENWGAFDFLLLELAENFGVAADKAPAEIVRSLMLAAHRLGLDDERLGLRLHPLLPEGVDG
jgi:hypothetical protein